MAPSTVLVLATLVLAVVGLVNAAPHTVRLGRHKHVFRAGATRGSGRREIGNQIPMNGGVLTLGAYFTTVTIGSGAGRVSFDAIVDTGSSNTAVPSLGCTNCNTTVFYDYTLSPTASPLFCDAPMCVNCIPTAVGSDVVPTQTGGVTNGTVLACPYGPAMCRGDYCGFAISYGGSGTATAGTTTQDVVCLGDACAANGYVNQIINEYPTGTQNTGIIGFAYPANACNPTCQPTLLDSMVASGTLAPSENLFGMCITPTDGGAIDLGYVNASRAAGEIQYTAVILQEWYNIHVRDVLIGGSSIGVPEFFYRSRNDAIGSFVDSGTSVILFSPYAMSVITSIFQSTYANLPGVSMLFGGQCTTLTAAQVAQYPRFDFVIAGMEGQPDFNISMTGKNYLMATQTTDGQTTYCLGIQGVPSIGIIFGDLIMENYYIVFDRVGARLGFAPIASCN